MFKMVRIALCAVFAVLSFSRAFAQEYPSRTVTLVNGYAAGGGSDLLARAVANKINESLPSARIIVENKPGASGVLAAQYVSRAKPDGYTLYLSNNSLLSMSQLFAQGSFDPEKSLVPISAVGRTTYLIATHSKSPFKTMKEFIAYAKANPGKLNYTATAAITQLQALQFIDVTGVDIQWIPYKGGQDLLSALLGQQIDLVVDGAGGYLPSLRGGSLVALATTGPERAAVLPDVPTVRELGLPSVEMTSWWILVAPADTPSDVVTKMNGLVQEALKDPKLQAIIARVNYTPIFQTAAETAEELQKERALLAPLVSKFRDKLKK